MAEMMNAGRAGTRTGVRIVRSAADTREYALPALDRQAARVAARFGLSPATARLVAELAFRTEARR